jgi:hypothetical protein
VGFGIGSGKKQCGENCRVLEQQAKSWRGAARIFCEAGVVQLLLWSGRRFMERGRRRRKLISGKSLSRGRLILRIKLL